MASSSRGDLFGRIVGFLVFVLGLGVILGVLWIAFRMFQSPNLLPRVATGPGASELTGLTVGFAILLVKIVLLFLGSLSGSMLMNRGIGLYFAALQPAPPRGDVHEPPAARTPEPR
jgi:hypothetical protein